MNISQRIRDFAKRFPEKPALIFPQKSGEAFTLTFKQLDLVSDIYAWDLLESGILQGTRTILIMRNTPGLYIHIFALFKIGAIPIVVDPGIGIKRVLRCYRSVQAEAFIGIPAAHFLRHVTPWAFSHTKLALRSTRRKIKRYLRLPFPIAPVKSEDLLMINFTTGSTGAPKGVEYTHAMANAMVEQIRSQFKQDEASIDVATLSLFALFDVLMGSTSILPVLCTSNQPADIDPKVIVDLIQSFKATHLFGSPAFLKNFGTYGLQAKPKAHLPSLKHVVCGGAPVSGKVLLNVRELVSNSATIHSTYGATEAIPICSGTYDEAKNAATELQKANSQLNKPRGVCVGKPNAGLKLRLIQISDSVIRNWSEDLLVQKGDVGEITIAGPHVSKSYHLNGAMNSLTKIQGENEVWHRTGDLGWLDESQNLWFCGRKKHIVNSTQGPLYSVQIESYFNSHPMVYRSALVGIGPTECQTPVICIELHPSCKKDFKSRQQIERELLEMAGKTSQTSSIRNILFHPQFPVDIRHNAKIDREQLSYWANLELSTSKKWTWVPIAGWIFILFGLLFPFEDPLFNWIWWTDVFLSVVVHGLQLFVTVPFGKKAGIPFWKSFVLTLLFGATVWKPAFESKLKFRGDLKKQGKWA